MFENFYRFKDKPFQLAPNPEFLFKSEKHQNALTYLEYGLTENVGIIVLTGEVGSGKTTTVMHVLNQIGDGFDTAMITHTNITSDQMLRMVHSEFEIESKETDKVAVLEALNEHLIALYAAGKRALLVIDEAQNLSAKALEEIRMLSNLQSNHHALLQILLVGQPELLETLKKPEMRQFSQRVAVHFHLTALDKVETTAYIVHRVHKAGGRADLFTPAAVDMIYDLSGGIPRSINLICQAALVYGFSDESERITQDTIKQINRDNIGMGIVPASQALGAQNIVGPESFHPQEAPLPEDMIENFRMEIKGRFQQLEQDIGRDWEKALFQSTENILKQMNNALYEERRQNKAQYLKIVALEKQYEKLRLALEKIEKK